MSRLKISKSEEDKLREEIEDILKKDMTVLKLEPEDGFQTHLAGMGSNEIMDKIPELEALIQRREVESNLKGRRYGYRIAGIVLTERQDIESTLRVLQNNIDRIDLKLKGEQHE